MIHKFRNTKVTLIDMFYVILRSYKYRNLFNEKEGNKNILGGLLDINRVGEELLTVTC